MVETSPSVSLLLRESIVDELGQLVGYVLTPRATQPGLPPPTTADFFQTLANSDADSLIPANHLFVSCTQADLTSGVLELLKPEQYVLRVPSVAGHNPAAAEALFPTLRKLREIGFKLAFSHAALTRAYSTWLVLADYILIDTRELSGSMLESMVKLAQKVPSATLVALNVTTHSQHTQVSACGIHHFHGAWFTEPVAMGVRPVAPAQSHILRLINLVRSAADVDEIEGLLKRDPTLSFKLLRYINSSGFGLSTEITSFRHAVMILGYQQLFRWAVVLLTAAKGECAPAVGNVAVLRGRLMENLVRELMTTEDADNAFVAGVFSLLDTMLGQTMEQALESLSLPQVVHDALLRREGPLAPFLKVAEACESGTDAEVAAAADAIALSSHTVNMAHLEAVVWSENLLHGDEPV